MARARSGSVLLFLCICLIFSPSSADFWFPKFEGKQLKLLKAWDNITVADEMLKLNGLANNELGRTVYTKPLTICPKNGSVVSFTTNFTFSIQGGSGRGDGFAFLITPKYEGSPAGSNGKWLGLLNADQNTKNAGDFVAVEYDTLKNAGAPWNDINDNHIAIDVNNISSIAVYDLYKSGIDLANGQVLSSFISYDGKTQEFNICVANSTLNKCSDPVISKVLDLCSVLDSDQVYMGFSAGTETEGPYQSHNILTWRFIYGETVSTATNGSTSSSGSGSKSSATSGCGFSSPSSVPFFATAFFGFVVLTLFL